MRLFAVPDAKLIRCLRMAPNTHDKQHGDT